MSSNRLFDCKECCEGHEKQAFISHASKDEKIARSIAKACCNAEVAPYLFEFSPDFSSLDIPADTLSERVRESNILFVLLGEQVSRAFWTQAWIGFEIGVARGMDIESNREIWNGYFGTRVIAVQDIRQGIEVSVPRLDALLLFDFNSDETWNEFEDAVRFLTPLDDNQRSVRTVNYDNPEPIEGPSIQEFHYGNKFRQSIIKANVICKNCKNQYEIWVAIQDVEKLGMGFNPINDAPVVQAECTVECPSCDKMVTQIFTQNLGSDVLTSPMLEL